MDEKRLLEIVKTGCPKCGGKDNLFATGYEAFKQGIGYLKAYNEVTWDEPDHDGDLGSLKDVVVHCSICGWEEEL